MDLSSIKVTCIDRQWFHNKPASAGVPPAAWLHVDGYSGDSNQLTTNKLILSQPTTLSFADTYFKTF